MIAGDGPAGQKGAGAVRSGAAEVAEAVRQVAVEFPPPLLRALADAIEGAAPLRPGIVEAAVHDAVPQAHYRAVALRLVAAWRAQAPALSPQSLAFALLTAGRCEEYTRSNQTLEPVWTGPEVETIPPRRTDQALLQVIESAKTDLTIVSFVVYKIPTVSSALAAAARRGVAVRLVIEDPEVSQGKVAFDALRTFGPDVAAACAVYVWPRDQRPRDALGAHGSLHAKCAVADSHWLLISSANLTEFAFQLNLEMGLLVKGGTLPHWVAARWNALIEAGILQRIDA